MPVNETLAQKNENLTDVVPIVGKTTMWMILARVWKMKLRSTRTLPFPLLPFCFLSFRNGSLCEWTTQGNVRIARVVCLFSHSFQLSTQLVDSLLSLFIGPGTGHDR